MGDVGAFLGIALGVLVAIVYPILKGYITREFAPTAGPRLPPWVKKYAALAAFCLLTAFVVLGFYRSNNPEADLSFWAAVVLGFGWESTVEKLFASPLGTATAEAAVASTRPNRPRDDRDG
jgi:hypothetical protein